ncbi:MAG: oligosaccharide flippase family protein [Thermoplasmata archaeon]|nr:MAG: oligosaccharide flippase family protein [Thermoplasmata archaeon]
MEQRLTEYTKFNLVGFVISTLAGFLGGIVIARTVGTEGVGIVAAAWALVELAKPWGTLSIMPAIRKSFQVDDPKVVFGTSFAMHLMVMVPAAIGLLVLSPQLADVLDSTASVVAISATVLIAFIPASLGIAVLDSRKDFRGRNIVVIVTNVSYLLFLVVLAVPTGTVEAVVASNVLSSALASVLCLKYLTRPVLDRPLAKYFVSFGTRTVAILFSNQVVFWLGVALTTAYLGASSGGIYRVSVALAYYAFLLPDYVVTTYSFPTASSEHARGGDVRPIYRHATAVAVALSLLLVGALVVLGRIVLGFYGEEFVDGYEMTVMLGVAFALYAPAIPAISILLTLDRPQRVMEATLARAIVFIAISIALIPTMDETGIVLGVAVSSVMASVWLTVLAIREMGRAPSPPPHDDEQVVPQPGH